MENGNPRRIASKNVPNGATWKRQRLKTQLERKLSNKNSMVPTSFSGYLEAIRKIINKRGPRPALITVQLPMVLLGALNVDYPIHSFWAIRVTRNRLN